MKANFCKVLLIGLIVFATYAFAENADRPDVHVGDRWSWQHINGLANEKDFTQIEDVVEVSGNEIRARMRTKGRLGSIITTYTREWNPVDTDSAQYAPYLNLFAFPLDVGKKWDSKADKMLFSSGKHGKFSLKGEVVAFEKVTVPAGTFDAYKINIGMDATSTDEDAITGTTVETCWFAPAVKRYVKREITFSKDGRVRSKDIDELLEFSLR
ncbi:MAG: hypothetical protein ABSA46_02165 [Thermodesulfovibrionales bacterium]|jgi:hypothetical protein